MDDHANRELAYMAQTADEGIKYKTQGGAQLIAYSDSDCAVAHSTTECELRRNRHLLQRGRIG
eukprot:3544187-Pleurochrysis_carterae.AAC.4